MLPDRVSNPGPLTYESGALPIALRGPALLIELWFLNAALFLLALYQYIKFHSIPFYTFKFTLQKVKTGSSSVNTGDRATFFAICHFP